MKKFLFAVVMLSVLAPFTGIAEPTHPNEIGLYTEPNGYGATGTYEIGTEVEIYLVLTKPEANNVPLAGITAFECQLNFDPFNGIFKTVDALNGDGLNIGEVNSLGTEGFLEYIVGFADMVPAVDDACLLITFRFIHMADNVINVTLGPISSATPYYPDQMDFVTPFQTVEIMYSVGGSHDAPVFIFGGEAISVENESFGSVKALYR